MSAVMDSTVADSEIPRVICWAFRGDLPRVSRCAGRCSVSEGDAWPIFIRARGSMSGIVDVAISDPPRALSLVNASLRRNLLCGAGVELGGERTIVGRSEAFGIIEGNTLAVSGSLPDSDRVADDGLEHRLSE